MKPKIKKEFEKTCIGFNGSSEPLKDRTDIDILFELATSSGNQNLLNLFEEENVEEIEVVDSLELKKPIKNVTKKR